MITRDMIKKMQIGDILKLLASGSAINNARLKFSSHCGKIENAHNQRTPLSPVEMRRMEFLAVLDIVEAYNRENQDG